MISLNIFSRGFQAKLLVHWKIGLIDTKNRDDGNIHLQPHCPSLLTMFHMAIDCLSPKKLGKLLAVTQKCALQLNRWVTTPHFDSQLFNDLTQLRDYLYLQCPADVILDLGWSAMHEIAFCFQHLKEPGEDWRFYSRFFDAVLVEIRKALKTRYSFSEVVSLSREYRREMLREVELPQRSAPTAQVPLEADVGVASGLVDNRIPPSEFCKTTNTFPGGETCPVCAEDMKDKDESESIVVTKCGHYYHSQCLDSWVNDSGSFNSKKCPSCRAVLCT